jgi:transcriptional regulator
MTTLYIPPHFRVDDADELYRFVEANAFATLISTGAEGLHVSHVPLLPERDGSGTVRLMGHVARGNEHWQVMESASEVLAIFHGPHAYVSPSLYSVQPSVPSWNYAVVHAHCKARLLDEAELHDALLRLSATYEQSRPKPWKMSGLPADYVSTMLKAIVGFELEVTRLEGKYKLSQNRPVEIPRVAAEYDETAPELATLMRDHAPNSKG